MNHPSLRVTQAFADAYGEIASEREVRHITRALVGIQTFPNMGSSMPRASLVSRYGEGIRTLVAGSHVIVYQVEEDTITLLALVPGKLIL